VSIAKGLEIGIGINYVHDEEYRAPHLPALQFSESPISDSVRFVIELSIQSFFCKTNSHVCVTISNSAKINLVKVQKRCVSIPMVSKIYSLDQPIVSPIDWGLSNFICINDGNSDSWSYGNLS
jgi:hypothetical protein